MRMLSSLIGAGLAVYAGLALLLYVFQGQLIYFPNVPGREVTATPADAGLGYEPVKLATEDGETLDGWFVPAPNPRGTLLYLHGNAGNIGHRVELIEVFHRLGLNVLIFDYRGYGRSSGTPTEQGTYRDALAAWRYLTATRRIPGGELYYFGESLGGAIAAWLAMQHPPRALMLYATFSSMEAMARKLFPFLPAGMLVRLRYDTRAALANARYPLFIMHSPQDEIVPYAHARALLAAAQGPRQLLPLRGGHNDAPFLSMDLYPQALAEFLEKVEQNDKPGTTG